MVTKSELLDITARLDRLKGVITQGIVEARPSMDTDLRSYLEKRVIHHILGLKLAISVLDQLSRGEETV